MTASAPAGGLAAAVADIVARLERLQGMSAPMPTGDLAVLERDIAAACEAAVRLPAEEAHAIAPAMKIAIDLLDGLAERLRRESARSGAAESVVRQRDAAAAYRSSRNRLTGRT